MLIEMKRYSAAFLLSLLSACTGQELFGQKPGAKSTSALHVTAEDLLATPVGENWPSYNGDYT
jgi:hypothetical protein